MTWDEALKNARGELGPSAFDKMQQQALNFKHDGYSQQVIADKLSVSRWTIRKLLDKPQFRQDGFKRYYYHYSNEALTFDKYKPVDDKVYCGKPKGLWLSVETIHDTGWWGFLETLAPMQMYRTRFGVNPGRLLIVSSPWDDDVEGLAVVNLPSDKMHNEWDRIRQQWDGIVVPDWERNISTCLVKCLVAMKYSTAATMIGGRYSMPPLPASGIIAMTQSGRSARA